MSGASTTALMTAFLRAVHARRDPAPIFDDQFGERMIAPAERRMLLERFLAMLGEGDRARIAALEDPDRALDLAAQANPAYGGVVVRSRWSEDRLLEAVGRGVRQYVILGAGLDSFAFRRPAAAADVQVFELDTAATQALKRERAAAAGLAFDARVHLTAADLEQEGVGPALRRTPHRRDQPAFVACLGVLPYLTGAGVRALLASIAASVAAGSELVFDYLEPEAVAVRGADADLERLRRELAASGSEAWRSGLDPVALPAQLAAVGFSPLEDLDGGALQARYGAGRDLKIPRRMHASRARVAEG